MGMWSVTVFNTTPEGCDALREESIEAYRASIVANWEVGHEGPDWIMALAKQGQARQLRSDWFPSRFVVSAGVVQSLDLWDWVRLHQEQGVMAEPTHADGQPKQQSWYGRLQVRQFHPERLRDSAPDAVWTVDVWDMH